MEVQPPSFRSLYIEPLASGNVIAQATGFVTNSKNGHPLLITNRHVVTGRDQETDKPLDKKNSALPDAVRVWHHAASRHGWISKDEPLLGPYGPRWLEHPTLKDRADLVALPLTQLFNGISMSTYDVNNPGADLLVRPSDGVCVVGFPFGVTGGGFLPIWATGALATEEFVDHGGLPVMLIDCRSRPGQSGSPVVAVRSSGAVMRNGTTSLGGGPYYLLLGVYSGRINDQSDLGRVWKLRALKELVDSVP